METIKIKDIDASGRLRPVNEDHALHIAEQIEKQGLKQPIVVRPIGEGYKLVIGGHRLRAMTILGWAELTVGKHVLVAETSDLDAEIDEIVENIARHELNATDRALFAARLLELDDAKYGSRKRGGDRKSNEFKDGKSNRQVGALVFSDRFSKEAQERVGLSQRSLERLVQIARGLSPDVVKALRGTPWEDNQQELLFLTKQPRDQHPLLVAKVVAKEAKTVAQAVVACGFAEPIDSDNEETRLTKLWALLDKIPNEKLAEIQKEVVTYVRRRLSKKGAAK